MCWPGAYTSLNNGILSEQDFGIDALPAVLFNLETYAAIQPHPNISNLVIELSGQIGLELTFAGIKQQYGSVTRVVRPDGRAST